VRRRVLVAAAGVGNQVLGDAPDDLGNLVLPLLVPLRHLDLAARQRDDARPMRRAGRGDGQILNEGMEKVGTSAVAIEIVQHLVEEQEHGCIRGLEHTRDGVSAGRRCLRRRPEGFDAFIAGELARDVYPGRLAPRLRIPRIAHKYRLLLLRREGIQPIVRVEKQRVSG
jgi:hypothetical protein